MSDDLPDLLQPLEAEQALLGALLFDASNWLRVPARLAGAHFFEPLHGRLFDAIAKAVNAKQAFDAITLAAQFASDPAFLELGGRAYLGDLYANLPFGGAAAMAAYADLIVSGWQRRQIVAYASLTGRDLQDPLTAASDLISDLQDVVNVGGGTSASMTSALSAATSYFDDEGDARGIMTGLDFVDERLGGLRAGHLIVLAGRPSMGKTCLGRNVLFGAAECNPDQVFHFFSMEMTKRELVERAVSAASYKAASGDMVSYSRLAKMTHAQRSPWRHLARALPSNIVIDDSARVSARTIRQSIWSARASGKQVGAVCIDQLDLMERPDARGRNEASVIGETVRELKLTAMETGVPIVLLVQLNRGPESREDKRPTLADLRGSGEIEQHANTVCFVYREAYYAMRAQTGQARDVVGMDDNILEVITAKQRCGPIGTDKAMIFAAFDAVTNGAGGAE